MIFEHFALNVPDSKALADWYVKNCEMKVIRSSDQAPFVRFLADRHERVCAEIYTNTQQPFPNYAAQHPALFHFAFAVENATLAKEKLLKAGAVFVEELRPDEKSLLVMLRDPWGIALQICQRSAPMAKGIR